MVIMQESIAYDTVNIWTALKVTVCTKVLDKLPEFPFPTVANCIFRPCNHNATRKFCLDPTEGYWR